MRDTVESIAGKNAKAMMNYTQNLARQNMEVFRQSMKMFSSAYGGQSNREESDQRDEHTGRETELEAIQ